MSERVTEGISFERNNYTSNPLPEATYDSCIFESCNFSGSDLSGSRFVECEFRNCDLSMVKMGATVLNDVRFNRCKMLGLRFSDCNELLFAPVFIECNLNLSSFYRMKMKGMVITRCSLQDVDFAEADMSGVVFDDCDLGGAIFENTILEKADFRTSVNWILDPDKNWIKKAKFSLQGIGGLLSRWDIEVE